MIYKVTNKKTNESKNHYYLSEAIRVTKGDYSFENQIPMSELDEDFFDKIFTVDVFDNMQIHYGQVTEKEFEKEQVHTLKFNEEILKLSNDPKFSGTFAGSLYRATLMSYIKMMTAGFSRYLIVTGESEDAETFANSIMDELENISIEVTNRNSNVVLSGDNKVYIQSPDYHGYRNFDCAARLWFKTDEDLLKCKLSLTKNIIQSVNLQELINPEEAPYLFLENSIYDQYCTKYDGL